MLASILCTDAVRSRMKAERGKSYGTEGGAGEGGGGVRGSLLACVRCGVWCDSERSFCSLVNPGSGLV